MTDMNLQDGKTARPVTPDDRAPTSLPVDPETSATDESEKAVQIRLSETLFGTPTSILIGSTVGVFVAGFVAYETMNPWLFALSALLVLASIWRTLILVAYHRDEKRQDNIFLWQKRFAIAVLTFSALLGTASFLSLVVTDNTVIHMFLLATMSGFVCTASIRHVARPWIGGPQVMLMILPVVAGLLFTSDAIYWSLAAICVFQAFSLIELAKATRNRFIEAFRGTERQKILTGRLRERTDLFDTALNNMNRGFAILDDKDNVVEANNRLFSMMGVSRSDLGAVFDIEDLLAESVRNGHVDREVARKASIGLGENRIVGSEVVVHTSRSTVLQIRVEKTGDDQAVLSIADITSEWKHQQEIKVRATTDTLTGLRNRGHALDTIHTLSHHGGALLFLDLDGFKLVNDLHGHGVGDELLRKISASLTDCMRDERDVLGRIGGDEFVVFLTGVNDIETAEATSNAIIEKIAGEHRVHGRSVRVGVTIGVSLVPPGSVNVDEALGHADIALHDAKKANRKNSVSPFDSSMKADAMLRVSLEEGLRHTLARGGDQLSVVYQPIVDTRTRKIVGCEALVRWAHPVIPNTPPDKFIPIAEESFLIVELGEWVLRTACREASTWAGSWRVAVNLSPVQFMIGDIVETVSTILRETGLPASRLELEFTERTVIGDQKKVGHIVRRLKALGVRIALDDFGTGYSSLSYIHELDFDKIKIDRSFIENLSDGDPTKAPMGTAIVSSVVAIAATKGLSVVAEGIETEGQLSALQTLGVAEGQGYLFARPLAAAEFRKRYASPVSLVQSA